MRTDPYPSDSACAVSAARAWAGESRLLRAPSRKVADVLEAEETRRRLLALVRAVAPSIVHALQATRNDLPDEWQYQHDQVATRIALLHDYREAAADLIALAPHVASRFASGVPDEAEATQHLVQSLAILLEGMQFDPISRAGQVDVSPDAVSDPMRRHPLLPISGPGETPWESSAEFSAALLAQMKAAHGDVHTI